MIVLIEIDFLSVKKSKVRPASELPFVNSVSDIVIAPEQDGDIHVYAHPGEKFAIHQKVGSGKV